MSRRPRGDRVLVYCPAYPFQPVRPITTDLLPWVSDATHWHPYVIPYPEAITFAMARLDYPCPTQGMLLSSPRAKRVLAQWFKPSYIRALVKDPYLSRWSFTTEVVRS